MLNALVDVLGAVLDRVMSFVVGHWIFLILLIAAAAVSVWGPALSPAQRRAKAPAATLRDPVVLLLVVLVSLALSIGGAALHGMPLPAAHDDFAYLLDGDTFAHGRLSNPTPPLWPHFETMHVLMVPRYIAKFPIGQGVIFAVGTILFGRPLAAMWIVAVAACAAIWWALRVWTTPSLALLGGLAAAVHPTFLDWTESYHGGALAALGGALLLAGAGKLRAKPSVAISAAMGVGVVFLAVSRPYEGLVFAIAIAILLLVDFRCEMLRVAPAGLAIAIAGLLFIAYDNWSITGNPLLLPYSVYEQQYDPTPNFLWEHARPIPHYRNAEMEFVYRVFYLGQYKRVHAPGGLWDETAKKFDVIESAILGRPAGRTFENAWPLFWILVVALLALIVEDRVARRLSLALLIFAFAPFSIIWWLELHYLAPATAVIVCLAMLALRRTFAASPILGTAIVILFFANAGATWNLWIHSPERGSEVRRQAIVRSLTVRGGKHLVIVAPDVFDAVYNGADLQGAPVIWARDLGPSADAKLRAYYRDRTVWWYAKSGIRRY